MKVLLLDDIEKLGFLGDVVEVKQGYARNYLLPQRLATVPTEQAIKSISQERIARAEQRKLALEQLKKVCQAVEGAEVVIAAKTNEQGHLFGSVSEKDIAENLQQQGFQVTAKMVRLDENIKEVGEHKVQIRFAAELAQTIKVTVVAQQEGSSVESVKEKAE